MRKIVMMCAALIALSACSGGGAGSGPGSGEGKPITVGFSQVGVRLNPI